MSKETVPFVYQLTAGAIAGISEISIMYPLDGTIYTDIESIVVKTRLQLQKGHGEYKSVLGTLHSILKNEGVGRLYRGILAPIMVEAPKRAVKFAANEQYTALFKSLTGRSTLNQPLSILTGMCAGTTEAFVVVSFELVKIRMQDKANANKYMSTLDCFVKVLRNEGVRAFATGLEATIWRHASWNGGYFGSIHYVRNLLPTDTEPPAGDRLYRNFISGAAGGIVGTMLNTPFDVIKTRVQNQTMRNADGTIPWTLRAMATIIRTEGYGALYKGFVPKVLRRGPGGGILLVVFDYVIRLMQNV